MSKQQVDPALVGAKTAKFVNDNYAQGEMEAKVGGFAFFYTQQVNSRKGDERAGTPVIDPTTSLPIGLGWDDTTEVQGLLVQGLEANGVPDGQTFSGLVLGNAGEDTFWNASYARMGLVPGDAGEVIRITAPIQGTGQVVTVVQWPTA